jgi:RNA polymerase sigma factor (sigma-70 family)
METWIRHLRRAMQRQDARTDGQLLASFIDQRDDGAFAALVHRHCQMVFGVCRRLTTNYQDAEDAFQATFLVLARKASAVNPREGVASWLHGVALRTAMKAKAMTARRHVREKQVTELPEPEVVQDDQWRDLQPLIDQELQSLPENYRLAILLCDLEGNTIKESARQLGWPQGTLATRLARGRKLLAKRLANRGVVLSASSLVTVLSETVASACVPVSLVSSTIKTAALVASGQAVANMVSAKVAALVEGAMKAMSMAKFKTALVLLVVCLLGWGGGVSRETQAKAQQNVPIGKSPIVETMPDLSGTWQGDDWGTVVLQRTKKGEFAGTYTDTFGTDVGRITVQWSPASGRYEGTWSEGKLRFGRIALQPANDGKAISGVWTADPKCEHQPGVPGQASLRWSRVKPSVIRQEGTKVGFTAWGKEVGGLQAGLSISNRKEIQIGGQATAVVKLRNLSNKSITASASPLWLTGPQVVDTQGKQVRATRAPVPLFEIIPTKITLQPGQTVEMAKSTIFVVGAGDEDQPVPEGVVDRFTIYVRPGTYNVGFAGFLQEHPSLATGTVEFKVKDSEAGLTAWGKEINGVQAGLGFLPGQKRAYRTGETVRLVVRVRNVGKKDVKFSYFNEFFYENPPAVTDGEGKPVRLEGVGFTGEAKMVEVTLAPGKEVNLCELNLELQPASEKGKVRPVWTLFGTGKFQLQHENVGGGNIGTGEIKFDPVLNKLATGRLELEVRDAAKVPDKTEQEAFTAWGKEAGGLQAGLGLRPAERRAYYHGETLTLVVRVRNVGKKAVKFEYLRQFLDETPPTVTDADGKAVPQAGVNVLGFHVPVEVTLEPGKEIELESRLAGGARLAGASGLWYAIGPALGTGKVSFQYERVLGNSSAGFIKLDPALSKLATGKLDLEIKSATEKK